MNPHKSDRHLDPHLSTIVKVAGLFTLPSTGAISDPIHGSMCVQLAHYRYSERYGKVKILL